MTTRIIVSGLAPVTTAQQIANFFAYYGDVEKAQLKKDPETGKAVGVGLVQYGDASSAELALSETEPLIIGGKSVTVKAGKVAAGAEPPAKKTKSATQAANLAKSKVGAAVAPEGKGEAAAGNGASSRIFVGGLSKTTTSTSLTMYFSYYGAIKRVQLKKDKDTGKPKGFAFVEFADPVMAELAVAETEAHVIDGREVQVREFRDNVQGGADSIFVGHLPKSATDEGLSAYFSYYGAVRHAKVNTFRESGECRGFGTVRFEDPASSELALLESDQHVMDGQKIEVRPYEKNPPADKIHVAGLSPSTTDESLSQYFAYYGEIKRAHVKVDDATGESRGFGLVQFVEPMSAELAVDDDHEVDAKVVRVTLFSKKPKDSDEGKIFVGGLAPKTTSVSLSCYFSNYGPVKEADVKVDQDTGASRGFGFVTFADVASAQLALAEDGHTVDGKAVRAKPSERNASSKKAAETDAADKIFVGGVGPKTTSKSLRAHFKQFGTIVEADLKEGRGFGTVQFADADSAALAIESGEHELDGKTVTVRAFNKGGKGGGKGSGKGGGKGRKRKAEVAELADAAWEEDEVEVEADEEEEVWAQE